MFNFTYFALIYGFPRDEVWRSIGKYYYVSVRSKTNKKFIGYFNARLEPMNFIIMRDLRDLNEND